MEQQGGYTLRDVFHVLFKRKWIIVCFFLSALAAGGAVAFAFNESLYQATAQIVLSPGREHISDLTLSTSTAVPLRVSFDIEEQSARTIEMLTGRYLSEQLVQAIGAPVLCREPFPVRLPFKKPFCDKSLSESELNDRVVAQTQENIHAERVGSAALVNVSFRHANAAIAAKAVNTLGSLYLDRHLGVLKNPLSDAFLQEQAEAFKTRLAQAEKELESFKAQSGIGSSIKEEQETATSQLATLQVQRNEIVAREAETRSRITKRKDGQFNVSTSQQDVLAMRARLLELERKESDMAQRLGDQNPELLALRQDIARTREAALKEEALHHQIELNGLQARQSTQEPRMMELTRKLQMLDRLQPEFDRLQQRAQAEQQNYRLYIAKSEETRVSNAMDAEKIASVRVIDPARTPSQPLNSKLSLKILMAAIFGLVGGLVIAFILEIFGDGLETAERAESVLGAPVLASIPNLRLK